MRFLLAALVACLAIYVETAPEYHLDNDLLERVLHHHISSKKDITEILKKAMEKFRTIIKTGDPKLGLPPMDPYVMDHREIKLELDILKGFASVDNMSLTGLSTFVTNSVSGSDDPLSAVFDVNIPTAVVDASHYILDVMLAGQYHIFGEGTLQVISDNLGMKGSAQGTMDAETHLQISALNVTVSIEKIKSNIEGLMNSTAEGKLANEMIEEFGPEVVAQYGNSIGNYFGDIIMNIINKKIANLTLDELIHMIES